MITYSEYAPTNIVWDKTMPSHWKCDKAKRFFSNPKELNKGNLEKNVLSLTLRGVIRNNVDNPIGLSPADYSTYQIFEANELVFKLIDLENISTSRVGIVNERGIMSSAYIRLKPITDMNLKYFYYQYYDWYKRNIFNGLGGGVRQTLSAPDLMELSVMYPPKDEQDQIVRFLDWEAEKVSRFITAKKKEIKLLQDLRNALICKYLAGLKSGCSEYSETKADYLWKDILTKREFSKILENYVQIVADKDEDTGKTSYKQIFPRYHQLKAVTMLLDRAKKEGAGQRYLIQHSAGSGKSNSIAWLAHQLVTLQNGGNSC